MLFSLLRYSLTTTGDRLSTWGYLSVKNVSCTQANPFTGNASNALGLNIAFENFASIEVLNFAATLGVF